MKLADATNEREFIEAVRHVFKAYVPESDGWAKPNFFDINATVIGGVLWSAVNEIRNGIDVRLNPQTAVGEHLDLLVSQPPLNLKRRSATKSQGFISVDVKKDHLPKGYIFKNAEDVEFRVLEDTDLISGKGIVEVESVISGEKANAIENQPLTSDDGKAISMGIYGGFDTECDEQLRRRYYASKAKYHFFGSQCSMEDAIAGFRGVTRSWVVKDGLTVKMLVLMEDKYPCGVPRKSDFDEMKAYFEDECLVNMFFCPNFESPEVITIAPEIDWRGGYPDDICEVTRNMRIWLRNNYDLGEAPRSTEIQAWLNDNYGEYDPKITGCCDYEPKCNAVYNCVELLGCGEKKNE